MSEDEGPVHDRRRMCCEYVTVTFRRRYHHTIPVLLYLALILLTLSSLHTSAYAQESNREQISESICKSQRTCGDCITADGSCAWCEQEVFDVQAHTRCATRQSLKDAGCPPAHIVQPKPDLDYIRDDPLSDAGGQLRGDAVQIYPQEIKIKLRPNTPYTIPVEFRQAEDYPVDLYYLMDLSKSMEDDKQKLATLGDLLSERMSKITSNFQLGFGSFVDKTVMPFVNTVPEKLERPCTLSITDGYCAPPYGFKHHMTLTQDTSRFKDEVLAAPVSGNLDSPEGGFDAIMQAVVCEEEVGWRRAARRLLIFSTDAGFHYAGDGKLGGIVAPNDGLCHLDARGYYTDSTTQDYPSISQLIDRISNKSVNVIFAVSGEKLSVYRKLSDMIDGSTAGQLANDSSNIVELVRENYDKITSKVKLIDDAPDHVKVNYKSTCLGTAAEKTSECGGLKVGSTVTFNVTVEVGVEGCGGSRRNSFIIKPADLAEELKVTVELDCHCPCEQPPHNEPHSVKCSAGNGTFECGQCTCYPGYFGRLCECSSSNPAIDDYDAMCRNPNSTSQYLCSGRGECQCGDCICHSLEVKQPSGQPPRVIDTYGNYCECDDDNCPRHGGQLCSGDHGVCKCHECFCNDGWKGEACECPDDNEKSCRAKKGEICNGWGICECGVCQCDPQSGYRGPTCEDCPTCEGQCDDQRYCVECHAFSTGKHDRHECDEKCPVVPVMVDVVEERKEEGIRLCQFPASDGCRFYFIYQYNDTQHLVIHVQKTRVCPEPVNTGAIIAAVVGGIVAIGLALLLIWKLLTTIHDRREFAKFEKERQNARWDTAQNPIFKQATSTFKNPTYTPSSGGAASKGGYAPVPS